MIGNVVISLKKKTQKCILVNATLLPPKQAQTQNILSHVEAFHSQANIFTFAKLRICSHLNAVCMRNSCADFAK